MQILAPIDFGHASGTVIAFANELAGVLNARVTLLHVYTLLDEPHYDRLRAEAERGISREMSALVEETLGPDPRARSRIDAVTARAPVTAGILAAARQADLLVMGQTEQRGVWRFMLGDVTGEIIERVDCPVLSVPAGATFHVPERIKVILEGRFPPAAYAAPLRTYAEAFGALLDVHQVATEELAEDPIGDRSLAGFVGDRPHDYHVAADATALFDFFTTSFDVAEDSWLCTVRERRSDWREAFSRALSERLAAIAPLPTLTLTPPRTRPILPYVEPTYDPAGNPEPDFATTIPTQPF